jgi:ABC-type nitrate/sulfonate/bicarbonate transport system permease component
MARSAPAGGRLSGSRLTGDRLSGGRRSGGRRSGGRRSGGRRSAGRLGRRTGSVALELAVPAALLAAWWVLSAGSSSLYFPPLSSIVSSLWHVWLSADLRSDVLPSLEHLALGLLIAVVAGVAFGVVLGLAPVLADAVAPILEFLRAIPGVALLPAALLLLGIGPKMQVSLIAYGTIWPILLNTADGVRAVDPVIRDVARSYRIGTPDRLLRIVIPAASPQIVTGIRTALSIGITVIVFSEMVGSTNGIGYQILQAQRSFAVPQMWAGMVLLGLIGFLLNLAFREFEHVVLRWHRGMRATSR